MQDLSSRPLPMFLFAASTLAPLGLFALGVTVGPVWITVALIYVTVFASVLDHITTRFIGDAPEGTEFPAADALLVAIALGHLALLPLAVWAVAGDSGLSAWARLAMFVGSGLWFGKVANPAAHELIHRSNRALFRLGALIYATLLFGHHTSAHRLVHHRFAASVDDPNTARLGESYYAFLIRAWTGSFWAGLRAESELRARGAVRGLHPYAGYFLVAGLGLLAGHALAGWLGVAVWVGLAAQAQTQLMLADYVQHYGLMRLRRADGRLEPVGARHSWNAPHWFSSAYMLNAPRHSDHHAHPARPYPSLRLPAAEDAPRLPWPLPVACLIALYPPLWKRAIRPHLARWRGEDAGNSNAKPI